MEEENAGKVRKPRKKHSEESKPEESTGNKEQIERTIEETEIKAELGTTESAEAKPRKRKGKSHQASEDDIKGIQTILIGIHAGIAAILKEPEFNLTAEESASLGKALAEVQAQYGVVANPKTMAIINLVAISAFIYIPKFKKVKDKNKEKLNERVNPNFNIYRTETMDVNNKSNVNKVNEPKQDLKPKTDIEQAVINNMMRPPN